MRQLAGRVACLAAALCLVIRGAGADPSVKPLRLRFDARFVLAAVSQQMGVTLRPDIAPPAVFLESSTPISQFRDAIEEQWGFRPHVFSNAYAIERNEIYLIDEPSIYVRRGRTIDGSLAHEIAHYIQVKYLNADLAEPSWEEEADEIQKWFRDMHIRNAHDQLAERKRIECAPGIRALVRAPAPYSSLGQLRIDARGVRVRSTACPILR